MRVLLRLMQPDLMSLYGLNKLLHRKDGARGAILRPLLVGAAVLYAVGVYLFGIAQILQTTDALRYMPLLTMLLTMVFPLFTTVFRVENVLFRFRGEDQLRSMPVTARTLVASRILVLATFDAAGAYLFLVPAVVVYAMLARPGAPAVAGFAVAALFSPLLPVALASLLGCLLVRTTARLKASKLWRTLMGFAVALGMMALSLALNSGMARDGLRGLTSALEGLADIFPLNWIHGAAQGNLAAGLGFALLSAAGFALCAWLIAAMYDRLTVLTQPRAHKSRRSSREQGVRSPGGALFMHECKRYFATPVYLLNTGFGPVLMLAGSVALAAISPAKMEQMMGLAGAGEMLAAFIPAVLALFVLMSSTTASSVSLDARVLPQLRAMPIEAKALLRGKLWVNLMVTMPVSLICSLVLMIKLPLTSAQAGLVLLTPLCAAFFSAASGLTCNLLMPKLDWQNETAVVKQSMSVLAAVLLGFAAAALLFAAALLPPALLLADVLLAVLALLLQRWNERQGYARMIRRLDA